jgi:hypothetical protein
MRDKTANPWITDDERETKIKQKAITASWSGSGKYGELSFVLKPNHLFKRLMVQNIKTPDQLAVIAPNFFASAEF